MEVTKEDTYWAKLINDTSSIANVKYLIYLIQCVLYYQSIHRCICCCLKDVVGTSLVLVLFC